MLSLVELQFSEHGLLALALQLAVQLSSLGLQLTNTVPTYTRRIQHMVNNTEQTRMYCLRLSAATKWIIDSCQADYLWLHARINQRILERSSVFHVMYRTCNCMCTLCSMHVLECGTNRSRNAVVNKYVDKYVRYMSQETLQNLTNSADILR